MLTSLHNDQVKHVISLQRRKGRENAKEFVIEGWRFVEEAVRRGARIKQVFFCPQRKHKEWSALLAELHQRHIPVEEIDERVLHKMSSTEEPQGILAVIGQKEFSWKDLYIDDKTILLVLDGIQDPGNLGTILRTALAAGVTQICLTRGTVDIYNPKVLRSTMGAIFSLVLVNGLEPEEILSSCLDRGLKIITGDIEGESLYKVDLELPLALVVGNEGKGPSDIFRQGKLSKVTIPMMNGVESLNVAMATGIMLYEIARRRDFSG